MVDIIAAFATLIYNNIQRVTLSRHPPSHCETLHNLGGI